MKQKVVLITGASAGMGKETAKLLLQNGYNVYCVARRVENMSELKEFGGHLLTMDVTDDLSVTKGIQTILEQAGHIDILINNAGFGAYGAVEDVTMQAARYQLEVNLIGAARLTQLVLPHMRGQHYGKIVNVSSIGGKIATPFGGWYHASKFALEGLSDTLRNEVKSFGIDVILIEPGGVKTEWGTIAFDNLVKTSANGAYRSLADKMVKAFRSTENKNADAIVIAQLIKKAIEANKPKARYAAGYLAKPTLLLRKILSDSAMDKLIMSQIR